MPHHLTITSIMITLCPCRLYCLLLVLLHRCQCFHYRISSSCNLPSIGLSVDVDGTRYNALLLHAKVGKVPHIVKNRVNPQRNQFENKGEEQLLDESDPIVSVAVPSTTEWNPNLMTTSPASTSVESEPPKSSGVSSLLDEALTLIGKAPLGKLRALYALDKVNIDGKTVTVTADMDTGVFILLLLPL